jgi:branched-chain amino acid transport system substrate-binding protein
VIARRSFVLGLAALGACRRADEREILVGAYLSLSGPDSTFGSDSKEGIELATAERNAAGGVRGRPIRVLYEDDKSRTHEASQKVRQLIDRDHVVALLGEAASSRSLAGGLIANTSRVPMITPSSTAVEVTQGREWVFRTCFTDDQQGRAAARFVLDQKKSRLALFYSAQDTYSSGLAKSFREELLRLGGTIVIDKGYPKGETSYRTFLAEIRRAGPELVFVPNYYNEMVLIARQAAELGMSGSSFVGGDGWDSTNLLEGAGAELEGAYFTNHYAPDVPWPSAKRFLDAFRAKFGHDPAGGSAQGYDAAHMLFDAMTRARDIAPDPIRTALAETKDFQGATGTMSMDAGHNVRKPIVVVKIGDRRFRYATQLLVD